MASSVSNRRFIYSDAAQSSSLKDSLPIQKRVTFYRPNLEQTTGELMVAYLRLDASMNTDS